MIMADSVADSQPREQTEAYVLNTLIVRVKPIPNAFSRSDGRPFERRSHSRRVEN